MVSSPDEGKLLKDHCLPCGMAHFHTLSVKMLVVCFWSATFHPLKAFSCHFLSYLFVIYMSEFKRDNKIIV